MIARAPLELNDTRPAFEVLEAEYRRLLGYPPDHELTERARELSAWARQWYGEHGRPWWYARLAGEVALSEGRVAIDGTTFSSPRLHAMLHEAGADAAALVAVSAGPELEAQARRLWEQGRPDEYFFLEVYGSAVVEALVASASFRLCQWADGRGVAVLPHYSPGYPEWDIADQQRLLDTTRRGARDGDATGIRVLDSGMLQPKKSLLAVFGITPNVAGVERLTALVPCANCSLPGCRYRRTAYRQPMPQIEAVRRAPADAGANGSAVVPVVRPVLTPDAAYSISTRALEKWARERLHLTVTGDRSVEARFRYEGTTCSNTGFPLQFEYHVELASRDRGYAITGARCVPAPGDAGHTRMCEYMIDADGLMGRIAAPPALLGRPLDEVVRWDRAQSPSGCFCTAESRDHKWGLVLEVLHFALARNDTREAP